MRWSDHASGRPAPDTLWPALRSPVEPAPLLPREADDLLSLDDYLAGADRAPGASADPPEDRSAAGAQAAGRDADPVRAMRYAQRPPAAGGAEPADESAPFDDGPCPTDAAPVDVDRAGMAAQIVALTREKETLLQMLADRQDAVGAAVARLEGVAAAVREQMTETVVRLATLIAHRVIERELEADPELVVTLTRAAVAQLENCTTAEVRVHPTDYAAVQRHLARGSDHVEYPIIRVVGDGTVPRGGCLVVTDGAEVDGLLSTRLRRLEESLRGAMTSRVAVEQQEG